MSGKRVSETEYGKLSLVCTVLFIVLSLVYVIDNRPPSRPPLIPGVWFYSFCLLGFISAMVMSAVAGFRESRWWWLAILPAGGCTYLMTMVLVFEIMFRNMKPWN